MLEYLREKEEYFYPEEEKEEQENSVEVEEGYGLDFVDDYDEFRAKYINVKEIPDNSDSVLDASEFMPNSKMQDIYTHGKGFDVTDNQDFYEVVKLVKDMMDKHLFQRDLTWRVDIAHRKAKFTFKLAEQMSKEADDFFLQGVQQYVMQQMTRKFGPLYTIDTEFLKDNGKIIMEMTVQKKESEGRKILGKIDMSTPESGTFGNTQSISKM
jgi:hypothetical protein